MNRSKALLAVLLFALVAGVWSLWARQSSDAEKRAGASAPPAAVAGDASRAPSERRATDEKALSPAPKSAPPSIAVVSTPKPSPILDRLKLGGDWKQVLDELVARGAANDADSLFFQAMILDTCSNNKGARPVEGTQTPPPKPRWAEKAGPLTEVRLQALETLRNRDISVVCRGIRGEEIGDEQIRAAFQRAATLGDWRAKAWLVEANLVDRAKENSSRGGSRMLPPAPTPEQMDLLKQALASKDPIAIQIAGPMLTAAFDGQSARLGEQMEELGPVARHMWDVVACRYGAECGDNRNDLLSACAHEGKCSRDYANYLYYYRLSPYDTELVERAATAIQRGIESGDWSELRFSTEQPRYADTIMSRRRVRIR